MSAFAWVAVAAGVVWVAATLYVWWAFLTAPDGCDTCQGDGWCTCHIRTDPERHVRRWPNP